MTTPATFSLNKLHTHALRCPECGAAQQSAVTTWDREQGNVARVTFACGHVATRPLKVTAGRGKQ